MIEKGGLLENISGRIRINNNTDSLFVVHNYGRIDLQDDVYLVGNYYDNSSTPPVYHTGGYDLYLYEDSEMILRGAEFCVGADEVYHPNYDGGRLILEGKAVIQLEDSALLHITSIDTLGAVHTPAGGILKIDAAYNNYAVITGSNIGSGESLGDRILIDKTGEIQGNNQDHHREISYLKFTRSGAYTYWQGIEFNSKIDDAVGQETNFTFNHCSFERIKYFDICTEEELEINFSDCSFTNNYRGLDFIPRKEVVGATVEKSNNLISTVSGCVFYDNYCGVTVQSDPEPENINQIALIGCSFGKIDGQTVSQGNSFGIMATGEKSQTDVNGCNFYDNSYGVYANGTFCQLGNEQSGYNDFQQNERPVYMSAAGDTSMVSYNTISDNETNGIYCYLGEFEIEYNSITENLGHGIVAISSLIIDNYFDNNTIEDNCSIEIYASAENIRNLQGGSNYISDTQYTIPQFTPSLNVWKNYSFFDIYVLAATGADSLMDVSGNTFPESADTLRFYPDYDLYDFVGSRNSSYNAGIVAYNEGDYETAIEELSDYICENPFANSSYCALPYIYFSEIKLHNDLVDYRYFSDTYLPYTMNDTLFYWQDKMLYSSSYLEDDEYSNAIDGFQEVIEYAPSYDDSLQASILQGYSYMLLTESGDRGSFSDCKIRTATIDEYCEYLLHCTEPGYIEDDIPQAIRKVYNYPNPFNPDTKICFELNKPAEDLTLSVYNIKGQKVWEYKAENLDSGKQEVIWSGKNRSGRQVASGVYLYIVKADKCKRASKMLLLK